MKELKEWQHNPQPIQFTAWHPEEPGGMSFVTLMNLNDITEENVLIMAKVIRLLIEMDSHLESKHLDNGCCVCSLRTIHAKRMVTELTKTGAIECDYFTLEPLVSKVA